MPRKHAVKILTGPIGRQLFGSIMRGRATIFMLHRITDLADGVHGHSVEFVRDALAALRDSGAKFVSLRTLVEAWRAGIETDPDWVVFTIDDGFADQAELVRQAFAPMNCPVTIFLITDFLDGKLWPWDDQLAHAFNTATVNSAQITVGAQVHTLNLSDDRARHNALSLIRNLCKATNVDPYALVARVADVCRTTVPKQPPRHFAPMTWDTVRELENHNVDFGPHSMSHRIFSQLRPEEARQELKGSWTRLREETRNPLPIFAWPTGRAMDFTLRDMQLARELEFNAAVSTVAGYATRPAANSLEQFDIHRFAFPNDVATALRYGSWLERGRQLLPF